ncbi:MAG: hypothetical protein U1C46_09385 [Bacteroidales bacterium]|nr:hypothetical protein [Bacteroidales bacterium]
MNILRPIFALIIIATMFIVSCDVDHCASYVIKNNSGHKLSLLIYPYIFPYHNIESLKSGDTFKLPGDFCHFGGPLPPFTYHFSQDSMLLFFDDTIRVIIFGVSYIPNPNIFGDKYLLSQSSWTEVKTSHKGTFHYYEYEFTEWHYQKALESLGN